MKKENIPDRQLSKNTDTQNKEAETLIQKIITSVTEEPVLSYAFLNWDIVQEKAKGENLKKWGGMAAGVMMGGPIGQMLFGGSMLSESEYVFSGQFGILIATKEKIYVRHFNVPFKSGAGTIFLEHLKLFLEHPKPKEIINEVFLINQTQISIEKAIYLSSGKKHIAGNNSRLVIDGTTYPTPQLSEIHNQVFANGALETRSNFLKKLNKGESPITEDQFKTLEAKTEYLDEIFSFLVCDKRRDELIKNFSCIITPVRYMLTESIRKRAASFKRYKRNLIISLILTVLTIWGAAYSDDIVLTLCVIGVIASVIFDIIFIIIFRESKWCKSIVNKL